MKTTLWLLAATVLAPVPGLAESSRDRLQREIFALREKILQTEGENVTLRQRIASLESGDPRARVEAVVRSELEENSSDLRNQRLPEDRLERALERALHSMVPRLNDSWDFHSRQLLDRLQERVGDAGAALSDVKNLASKAKWLRELPERLRAIQERKQCFSQTGQGLLACLDAEIRDSNSLIYINQRSIEMNQGRHCKYMDGWCERSNAFSRQIIAREQARIQDLSERKEIVRRTGDDPKRQQEISSLEARIARLQGEKQTELAAASELKQSFFRRLGRGDDEGHERADFSRLENCRIDEPGFCEEEAAEAAERMERIANFTGMLRKMLGSGLEKLRQSFGDAASELKSAREKLTVNEEALRGFRSELAAKEEELRSLGGGNGGERPEPAGRARLGSGNILEVFHGGEWKGVCDDNFSSNAAAVACRELGLGSTGTFSSGSGSGRFWLDDLSCNGSEPSLFDCGHREIGSHDCGASEHVVLHCR